MDGDLVLSLVLFGLFFFGLFYCYYSAQVRIKQEEYALSACERSLLQYHQHRFGGQEINTVSRNTEMNAHTHTNERPPDYGKVGLPPSYDIAVAGNPPSYSEVIAHTTHSNHTCLELPFDPAQDLTAVHIIPRDEPLTLVTIDATTRNTRGHSESQQV